MKRLVVFIALTTSLTLSLANTNLKSQTHSVSVAQRPTVIRSAQVRVNPPKIQKPKIFVGHPHKNFATDWDGDFLEVDDVITSYRRRDLNKIEHEDGISDRVRWQLFLARQLAMLKYKQKWG
jgi:hypothetical protein